MSFFSKGIYISAADVMFCLDEWVVLGFYLALLYMIALIL